MKCTRRMLVECTNEKWLWCPPLHFCPQPKKILLAVHTLESVFFNDSTPNGTWDEKLDEENFVEVTE